MFEKTVLKNKWIQERGRSRIWRNYTTSSFI